MQTFCTGGPGGQNQNRKKNGVRFVHLPTGLSSECRELKSYEQNRKRAFQKLGEKIKQYHMNLLRKEILISKETVRTYHEQDNRVTDHASGFKQAYTETSQDISDVVAARTRALQE